MKQLDHLLVAQRAANTWRTSHSGRTWEGNSTELKSEASFLLDYKIHYLWQESKKKAVIFKEGKKEGLWSRVDNGRKGSHVLKWGKKAIPKKGKKKEEERKH